MPNTYYNPNTLLQSGMVRAWLQKDGPGTAFEFLTLYGSNQLQRPRAAPTPIYQPSTKAYNEFEIAGQLRQPPGLITTQLETALRSIPSLLLALNCPFELQYRYGLCDKPDQASGWDKIVHLRGAEAGNYTSTPNGSRSPTNLAEIVETLDITGLEMFEVFKVLPARIGVTELQNALSVAISKNPRCGGICGAAVEICAKISIGTASGSYGTANLLISTDGGATFADAAADPFAANLAIVGQIWISGRLIVISDANTPTLAYSDDDGDTWTTVTFSGGAVGDLNDVFGLTFGAVYFCGDGGYVYISRDGGATLEALSEGDATTNNLNRIRVNSEGVGFAVGDSDTILKTTDGEAWALQSANTGAGDGLIALWQIDAARAWVGTDGGQLFKTLDGGGSWEEVGFSGSGSGRVEMVEFINESDGFMIHNTAGSVGRLFRTIDGGATWDLSTSVGNGSIGSTPTNSGLNGLAVCGVNSAIAVGNTQGGTAFVVKAE